MQVVGVCWPRPHVASPTIHFHPTSVSKLRCYGEFYQFLITVCLRECLKFAMGDRFVIATRPEPPCPLRASRRHGRLERVDVLIAKCMIDN